MAEPFLQGILSRTGIDGDESTCLKYLVKSAAVHHKVLDDRETGASPRLDGDSVAVLELTHVKLAGSNLTVRSVRMAVDIERAHTAYTLAAVVIEGYRTGILATLVYSNRVIALTYQLIVEDIEHLEKRGIG